MSSKSLATATLAIYVALAMPGLYAVFKHGLRHGAILGWAYLFVFFGLRIVSSGMQLHDPTSTAASLVSSIGLSPLLLSATGILHESRAYCIANRRRAVDLAWVIILHTVIVAAVALTGSGAAGANKTTATDEQRAKSLKHVKVGMILLLLSWLYICLVTAASLLFSSRRTNAAELPFERQGRWLLNTVAVALPLVGIRIITSLVYFTTQNAALNPVTGELGYKIGLSFIEELLISVGFVVAGLVTRNIGKAESGRSVKSASHNTGSTRVGPPGKV